MKQTRLVSRIPQIVAQLGPQTREAALKGAEMIAEDAKERVPVDSGDLRDAIHVEETDQGIYVMAGDSDVFYGHLVEHGTTKTGPRPFLIPAKEARREDVLGMIEDALKDL